MHAQSQDQSRADAVQLSKAMAQCSRTGVVCLLAAFAFGASGAHGATLQPAKTKGDPLMTGFGGCRWYLQGQAGLVYNLISAPEDNLNTLLVPANLTDEHHNNDGTFHGGIFIRHGNHNVTAFVDEAGGLEVAVDGQEQAVESAFEAGGMTGSVHRYLPHYGQAARIATSSFVYFIHAVQPYTDQSGFNRGHADVEVTVKKPLSDPHGLLGQSLGQLDKPCSESFDFDGDGKESDYVMAALSDVHYKYARFGKMLSRSLARKLAEVQFVPLVAKLS